MRTLPVAYPEGIQDDPAASIRSCVRCHREFRAVAVLGLSTFDPALSPFPDLCVGCRDVEAMHLPDRPLPAWIQGV